MKKVSFFLLAVAILAPSIKPALALSISDTYYEYQFHLSQIDGDPAYLDYSGEGIVVAVIDSGVWQGHPDLSGAMWNNTADTPNDGIDNDGNGYVDDYYGWNFVDGNSDMTTKASHGTFVAGIIAAQINKEGMVGIAPDAKIMSLTACSASCDTSDVYEAIYYAVDNGADVINLSLGFGNGYVGYTSSYDDVIQYAYDNGVVVVTSAGNGDIESGGAYAIGLNLDYTPVSPACNDVDGINTVLAVGSSEGNWSNYGSYVDVLAPGEDIISDSVPAYSGGYYDVGSGTSYSAPMVSAAAALILDKRDYYTNIDVIDRIISTTNGGVLNIEDALSQNLSIDFDDISSDDVNAGDQITFYGEHFSPRYSVKLLGSGSNKTLNDDDVQFLDATTMVVTLPDDLETDDYYVRFDNYDTRSEEFSVTAIETESSAASDEEGDEEVVDEEFVDEAVDTTTTSATTSTVSYGSLAEQLVGYILLQVEQHGEAWYVNPTDYLRYYMEDGDVAYEMMRSFGLGITDADLEGIPSADSQEEMLEATSICSSNAVASSLSGRILIQVEQHGEAWYIHPDTCRRIYMEDGDAAYTIMRYLSLGITDADLETISEGEIE
jgi:hypothetical protein